MKIHKKCKSANSWIGTPLEDFRDLGEALVFYVTLGLPFTKGHFRHQVPKASLVVPESERCDFEPAGLDCFKSTYH